MAVEMEEVLKQFENVELPYGRLRVVRTWGGDYKIEVYLDRRAVEEATSRELAERVMAVVRAIAAALGGARARVET